MFNRAILSNTNHIRRYSSKLISSPTNKQLVMKPLVRNYGREATELLHHVRNGHFDERGVSREVVDDCSICQTYPEDHTRSVVTKMMLFPWDKQWMALYEIDHTIEYDNNVVTSTSVRF